MLYAAGVSESIKKRIPQHRTKFENGLYNILDMSFAKNGERVEVWKGWPSKKIPPEWMTEEEWEKYTTQKEREEQYKKRFKDNNLGEKAEEQLSETYIFIAEIPKDKIRYAYRMEAALMHDLVYSDKPWADLADRGMALNGVRYNNECPILAKNI